jgi:hypothetical protein
MTGLRLSATAIAVGFIGVLMLGGSAIVSSSDAEAKICYHRTCAVRANFVCKGPIGSCGFQQGRCLRWRTVRVVRNSCGDRGGPVVR